jgi:hypothetical protein
MSVRPAIMFLAGAKDFHAMDKFRLASNSYGAERLMLVTDTVQGEGQHSHIQPGDRVEFLHVVDGLMPDYQSTWTHIWRNSLKLFLIPLQARRLRRLYDLHQPSVVHAVPMYYMVLCWYARIPFVGTPQGDEILQRPFRSRLYKLLAGKALAAATRIAVDSLQMKTAINTHFGRDAILLKNGFRTEKAIAAQLPWDQRTRVLSARGLQVLYRTVDILQARDRSTPEIPIDVVFPFADENVRRQVEAAMGPRDVLHGRLERGPLYHLMGKTLLVVSIPTGDSSPRSVYEAIFCGAAVALSAARFVDELPACMRNRIYIVDVYNPNWFSEAIVFAQEAVKTPYCPSSEALDMCDEDRLFQSVMKKLYRIEPAGAPESGVQSISHAR